jgi:phosphoglycerate dehydrogenase-like enzyme/glyoxylase-like metal-dependent hydrolase (beta-lactamase superfamily II)
MRQLATAVFLVLAASTARADDLPKMQFNEVREVAPGVFFRYSAISATDKSVTFGGSNNIWIVFEDHVAVIDATFPKEAGDVIAAIRKTTDKPIRYVLDTHHHGDHAYGNIAFAQQGASIVAQRNCFQWLHDKGSEEFREAGRGPTGRKDIAESTLKVPNLVFDDKLVLEDNKQRVEFLFLGHAHTPGDAFAYLPRQKILCTGDACVNGAFNFMGHSDSASWIRVLERAQQLDVQLVLPGHGPPAGKSLLEKQKRYFVELRQQVRRGIQAEKPLDDILASVALPWYKEWTGTTPSPENVKHVYAELTGRTLAWDLLEEVGLSEGSSPTRDTPGWTKPQRIVVPNLMPARLAELKRVAPEIEFVPVKTAAEAAKAAEDADAVLGYCSTEIVSGGKKLRWIQLRPEAGESELTPAVIGSKVVVTNGARVSAFPAADHAFALLLALTRGVREVLPEQLASGGAGKKPKGQLDELQGKTMLVVGLGELGTQVARRAAAFGMRVLAVDPVVTVRPDFVQGLDKLAKLTQMLPKADAVVLTCPLTAETRGLIGAEQLRTIKKTAYLINVSRGGLIDTEALVEALGAKQLAGAGLDATEPEPLPEGNPLRKAANVLITPHIAERSPESGDRQWRLWRENVRRFVAGEALLAVVDKVRMH